MVGSAFKKLAAENGMTVAKGVAYGSLRGFAVTLSEGSGYKQIVFTTKFTDPAGKGRLLDLINSTDLKKQYRVLNLNLAPNAVQVVFHDNPGTMKKIMAFLDWFIPLLQEHSATGVNICTECGCEITAGQWVLINGIAYHLHDSCAQKAEREVDAENTQRAEAGGSYLTGTIGALLGATLGAVVWGLVLYSGYVASIVGLVIGFLAEKGYDLLKGKQGKAKVLILILAIVFGVLLGTFAADAITLAEMMSSGELRGFELTDIPAFIFFMLLEEPEYRSVTLQNVGMGLLFAALGVFALLRNTGKAVADTKYTRL
ncbi:MAG: hypothetical protein IJ001_10370 [Oscillospiraceae bacterium]|nr:hypothetical protein [Oscillospiraceae bacterium]